MADIPTDHIQKVDNPVAKLVEECLTNPIVVNNILRHFSNRQLLELSLVNKMWIYEARSVMRKRGNLFAKFKTRTAYNGCNKFKDFQLALQRMNNLPFNEIRIELNFHGQDAQEHPCPTAGWVSNFEATLERLTLKHILVEFHGSWWDHKDCPILLFIKQVFHRSSPVLETLSLYMDGRGEAFIPTFIEHPSFPCLKIIQLKFRPRTKLVKALVSGAPNLQELQCIGNMNKMGKLLKGTSAVLAYGCLVKAPFDEISDNVIGALRLKRMELKYTGPQFNFERFDRIAPILLQVCCTTTFRFMTLDAVLAVPLMTYGVSFQKIAWVDMIINYDQLELTEPRILRILKDFDFTRIFPTLNKVTVERSQPQLELEPGHMNRIIEEANILREPVPDRAINIKELNLKDTLSNAGTQFYAEMFPSVRQIWIKDYSEAIPFESIWKYWQDLKCIRVEGKITGNLDSVFCGIFPEEVAELEQKDKKYLRKVNIVPVMPAVTCQRNLNKLTLDLKLSALQDPKLLFSNVTKLVAFKRSRGLKVWLDTKKDGVRKRQFWKF